MPTLPTLQTAGAITSQDLLLMHQSSSSSVRRAQIFLLLSRLTTMYQPYSDNLTTFASIGFLTEDDMASNSEADTVSQRSARTYIDAAMGAQQDAYDLLAQEVADILPLDPVNIDTTGETVDYVLSSVGDGSVEWDALVEGENVGVWETGDTVTSYRTSKIGWVLVDGSTIGSASSGADRANSDCEDLFTVLWDSLSDAVSPIYTSAGDASTRGASAAADWSANKRLTLPDERGRTSFGFDSMGGSSADRLTGQTNGIDGDILGASGGQQDHTLVAAEMAAHNHASSTLTLSSNSDHTHTVNSAGAHTHGLDTGEAFSGSPLNANKIYTGPVTVTLSSAGAHTHSMSSNGAHTHSFSGATDSKGSGEAHSNTHPGIVKNVFMKL